MSINPRIIPATETNLPRIHRHQPDDADADALHTQSSPETEQDPSRSILGRSIKPPVVRHYSWSEEDRKHALQARLLETEGEMGFSEVRRGQGGGMGDE
ncbi:hypothetical protein AnigIFM63309_004045 [Aspergillus niger]|nr:hypothetical protein AnigIFM50267_001001 [Aspergillus niger]GLA34018.1 hypothetical protein AnigIFM63309_004045 [Aspergillus niger]